MHVLTRARAHTQVQVASTGLTVFYVLARMGPIWETGKPASARPSKTPINTGF